MLVLINNGISSIEETWELHTINGNQNPNKTAHISIIENAAFRKI